MPRCPSVANSYVKLLPGGMPLRDGCDPIHPARVLLTDTMPMYRGAPVCHVVVDDNTYEVARICLNERTWELVVDQNHRLLVAWSNVSILRALYEPYRLAIRSCQYLSDVDGVYSRGRLIADDEPGFHVKLVWSKHIISIDPRQILRNAKEAAIVEVCIRVPQSQRIRNVLCLIPFDTQSNTKADQREH